MPNNHLLTPPAWVLPGARFDLDFANNRYYGGVVGEGKNTTVAAALSSLVVGPNNGVAGAVYAPDRYGFIQTFPTFAPRITAGCGLWAEGRYTNFALWCRDHTNAAWAKTTMTTAKTQTGADGVVNSASSLTATGALSLSLQAITLSSATYVFSAYVKRLTGSGTIEITLDGITYTNITSLINTSTYTLVSAPAQNTFTTGNVGFRITTSGDAIAVDFCQCENYGYPTAPLLTTTASVARLTDEPSIGVVSGGNTSDGYRLIRSVICTGGPWSVYCEATGNTQPSINTILTDWGFTLTVGAAGDAATMKGNTGGNTATSTNTGTFGLGNINKVCGRVSGAGNAVCLNGGDIAYGSAGGTIFTAQSSGATHAGLGNRGDGLMPLNGYIKRLAFWNFEIPDGQMIEFTR